MIWLPKPGDVFWKGKKKTLHCYFTQCILNSSFWNVMRCTMWLTCDWECNSSSFVEHLPFISLKVKEIFSSVCLSQVAQSQCVDTVISPVLYSALIIVAQVPMLSVGLLIMMKPGLACRRMACWVFVMAGDIYWGPRQSTDGLCGIRHTPTLLTVDAWKRYLTYLHLCMDCDCIKYFAFLQKKKFMLNVSNSHTAGESSFS